jgi:hypothetical protein
MSVRTRAARNQFGSAAALAELLPVVFLGALIFLFGIVNLVGVCFAEATSYLVALEACARAANAADFNGALVGMSTCSTQLLEGALGKMGRLTPDGGFEGSGTDLYILATNIYTNQTTITGPNKLLPSIDAASNVYQCETRCTFKSAPVVAAANIPGLDTIPGLGRPFELTCAVRHVLTNPRLFAASVPGGANQLTVAPTTNQAPSYGLTSLANWNYTSRDGFQLAPGQQILDSSLQIIPANQSNWQPLLNSSGAPIQLNPGQRLTVLVSSNNWADQYDNWVTWYYGDRSVAPSNGITTATLTAKIGKDSTYAFPMTPSFYNFSNPYAGVVYLRFNDTFWKSNLGQVSVTAYITN